MRNNTVCYRNKNILIFDYVMINANYYVICSNISVKLPLILSGVISVLFYHCYFCRQWHQLWQNVLKILLNKMYCTLPPFALMTHCVYTANPFIGNMFKNNIKSQIITSLRREGSSISYHSYLNILVPLSLVKYLIPL